jgi:hypothetical protein
MAAIAVLPGRARRATALTVAWLVIGLGLLAGSAVALYYSTQNALLSAYNAAPACAADAAAGNDCRLTTTATVTEITSDNGITEVYFDVPGKYSPTAVPGEYSPIFRAVLPAADTTLAPGDQVRVELWELKVTKVVGMLTADNPAMDPRPGTLRVIALLLLPFGLAASAWGAVRARRQIQGTPGETATGPGMGPLAGSDVLWR